MTSLLPCPFCGSTEVDPEGWMSCEPDGSGKKTGPACDECGGSTESVERWNNRITDLAQRLLERWHLASMNDGLFIINAPPRPSTDDVWHDRPDGPSIVLNVTELPRDKAADIVKVMNDRAAQPPAAPVESAPSEFDIAVMKERDALRAAALDFIAKVDRGEARSTQSYAAFKAALSGTVVQDHLPCSADSECDELHKTLSDIVNRCARLADPWPESDGKSEVDAVRMKIAAAIRAVDVWGGEQRISTEPQGRPTMQQLAYNDGYQDGYKAGLVNRIPAQPQGAQEPIYYRYRTKLHGGDWMVVLSGDLPKDKSGWEIEPLYGAPPQAAPDYAGILREALDRFCLTQKPEHYGPEHWSNRARAALSLSRPESK